MRIIAVIIMCCCVQGFSETFLSGDLKGTYHKDKYIVSRTITVSSGDTLIVEAGSELRFQPMTGIIVKGIFIVNGTMENAVLCASFKNLPIGNQSAAQYGWSGIRVADTNAVLRLSYVLFCDAGTAIDLQCSARDIVFDHVVFHGNGFLNVLRQGKPIGLQDDAEYLYRGTGKAMVPSGDSTASIGSNDENGRGSKPIFTLRWYVPVRVTLSCIALAGAGLWLSGNTNAQKYDQDYHAQKTAVGAVAMREKRDGMVAIQNIGMALCGIGAGFFSVTFLF